MKRTISDVGGASLPDESPRGGAVVLALEFLAPREPGAAGGGCRSGCVAIVFYNRSSPFGRSAPPPSNGRRRNRPNVVVVAVLERRLLSLSVNRRARQAAPAFSRGANGVRRFRTRYGRRNTSSARGLYNVVG